MKSIAVIRTEADIKPSEKLPFVFKHVSVFVAPIQTEDSGLAAGGQTDIQTDSQDRGRQEASRAPPLPCPVKQTVPHTSIWSISVFTPCRLAPPAHNDTLDAPQMRKSLRSRMPQVQL